MEGEDKDIGEDDGDVPERDDACHFGNVLLLVEEEEDWGGEDEDGEEEDGAHGQYEP